MSVSSVPPAQRERVSRLSNAREASWAAEDAIAPDDQNVPLSSLAATPQSIGIKPPGAVLPNYGSRSTSGTMIVRATANETIAFFSQISSLEIMSKTGVLLQARTGV
ncbi:hypothetical protein NM688_g1506 [Phlebia brevispora]|uniref:Uncharacterized protein n=1 Tax=Phlebia brevispora TaxID=194682 RepID=A0ACC1TBB3_9APHY|nr:hypothetical protein NM688_g1506 [Phlebia brevispora]